MGILLWVVFGLIAGAIAKYLMPGDAPGGIVATIILGIIGAVVGGLQGVQAGDNANGGIGVTVGGGVLPIHRAIVIVELEDGEQDFARLLKIEPEHRSKGNRVAEDECHELGDAAALAIVDEDPEQHQRSRESHEQG